MVVVHLHSELDDLKRATQVHVQAALFGFAVQRGRTVNDRISGVDQSIVIVARESETFVGQVTAKNPNPRLQVLVERFEIEMQLKCVPEAVFSLMRITRANQQVQGRTVLVYQISGDVSADVAGGSGQEYRHVAPLVPVLTVSAAASLAACRLRAGRASSGRPSIKGYVHLRSAGM